MIKIQGPDVDMHLEELPAGFASFENQERRLVALTFEYPFVLTFGANIGQAVVA